MFNKILNKLKIGSHYRIERFGWIFSLLSLGLLICMGFAWRTQMNLNKIDFKSRAIYSTAFETSRTRNAGSVIGAFSNKERTKAFVLLKMKSMTSLPADASDYRMYITNDSRPGNPRTSTHKPSGGIYMFGTSGYMGLYFIDNAGFEQAIKRITIRIGKELVNVDSNKVRSEDFKDDSFTKYDQFNVYINFGAEFGDKMVALDENYSDDRINVGLKESDVLFGDKIEATKLFKSLVIDPQEKGIKTVLLNDLKSMQTTKNLIAEYTARYEKLDIDGKHGIVPEEPMQMRGDEIKDVNGILYLKPSYVYPNGYNFVWQDKTIEDGYLKDVVPDGESALNYMINHDKLSETMETKSELWYLSDGSLLSAYEDNGGAQFNVVSDATTLRNQIIGYWNEYMTVKNKYQTADLRSLLELEITMNAVDRNYTVNDNADTLLSY